MVKTVVYSICSSNDNIYLFSFPGKLVYLLCNKEYTFGRKDCTVIIPDDASVSRKHLTLFVEYPEINVSQCVLSPTLLIKLN